MFPPFISDILACAVRRLAAEDYPSCFRLIFIPTAETIGSSLYLDRALDLTGAQASRADVNMLRGSVYERLDSFHVRLEGAVSTDVRVRYGDAKIDALSAELALCHSDTSY